MKQLPNLFIKIKDTLELHKIDKSKAYGLAFSGGPDSIFLSYALKALGFKNITLLYVDYHDSSYVPIEERIVHQHHLDIGYKIEILDLKEPIKEGNFENKAREIRYSFFKEKQKELNLEGVFIAHQKDDDILTYVMQKDRGGIYTSYGLQVVSYLNELKLIRPMLDIYKKEIIDYLNQANIEFFDDPTNNNLERLRNRLRIQDLDKMDHQKIINEKNTDNSLLFNLSNISKEDVIDYKTYYDLDDDHKMYLLYMYLKNKIHIQDEKALLKMRNYIYENLKGSNKFPYLDISNNYVLYRDRDFFFVSKPKQVKPYKIEINEFKNYSHDFFNFDFKSFEDLHLKPLRFPIYLTNVKKDSEFKTNVGHSSTYSFLKKNKVPLYLRDIYPCLTDVDGNVLYCPFYDDLLNEKTPFKLIRAFWF